MIFRHANVFANLFSLMLDANIPDIAIERDKTVKKVPCNISSLIKISFFSICLVTG
jgi:hypothetical protein